MKKRMSASAVVILVLMTTRQMSTQIQASFYRCHSCLSVFFQPVGRGYVLSIMLDGIVPTVSLMLNPSVGVKTICRPQRSCETRD